MFILVDVVPKWSASVAQVFYNWRKPLTIGLLVYLYQSVLPLLTEACDMSSWVSTPMSLGPGWWSHSLPAIWQKRSSLEVVALWRYIWYPCQSSESSCSHTPVSTTARECSLRCREYQPSNHRRCFENKSRSTWSTTSVHHQEQYYMM